MNAIQDPEPEDASGASAPGRPDDAAPAAAERSAAAPESVPVSGAGGEQYNPGPPTVPRQAAAVILMRDAEAGPEVLLVRRTPKARFMGGVWVFPGGGVRRPSSAPAGPRPGPRSRRRATNPPSPTARPRCASSQRRPL